DNAGSSDDLYVTGNLEVDGSVWLGDATADNITITGTLIQEGGGTFGNVRIASTDDQTIDTANGLLVIDSMTDTLDINTSLIRLDTQATTITLANVVEALNIDSDTLTIDASNNRVGIGIATPAEPLSILSDAAHDAIEIVENSGGETWQLGVDVEGDLNFADSGSTAITFEDGGNVGIGTSAPIEMLHIAGYSGRDGSSPPSIYLFDKENSQSWIAGSIYAQILFGSADISATGNGGVKNKIAAIVEQATGYDHALAFYTGSGTSPAERMRISSDGYMGIGTAAPYEELDVKGTIMAPTLYAYGKKDSAGWEIGEVYAEVLFGNLDESGAGAGGTKNKIVGVVEDIAGTYSSLAFHTAPSGTSTREVMRLTSEGYLGLGTSAPSEILHTVGGDVKIGMGTFDNAGSSDDLYVTGNLEVDGSVWLGDATADNITITGTLIQEGGGTFGNIRIASTDDQTIDTANGLLVLDSMTDTLDINTSLIDLSTQATTITLADVVDALNIDSDTFTIDASNDRVGIGTATPEGILHVAETGGATSIYFDTYEASGARTQLYLRSSRSDTIGTASATSDGDVLGDIRFTGVDSGNTFDTGAVIEAVQNGAASVKVPTDLRFYTSDSDSTDINMVIKSSGNVGIGTSLPSTTLDIDGTFSGTPSADTSIVAGTGVTVSKYVMKVQGDGGAVDITANPQITDGSDGQMVIIKGVSDTNTLKFDDGTGLALDSGISFTMGIGDLLHLMYDATEDIWYEISRTDN
ncbi:MAG: hypothetical protein P9X22_08245, partial [Candidatus Zapsychrus exili]|nr:hypothetical protein [Candidatus Zapsychrus exili]